MAGGRNYQRILLSCHLALFFKTRNLRHICPILLCTRALDMKPIWQIVCTWMTYEGEVRQIAVVCCAFPATQSSVQLLASWASKDNYKGCSRGGFGATLWHPQALSTKSWWVASSKNKKRTQKSYILSFKKLYSVTVLGWTWFCYYYSTSKFIFPSGL
jgi:hypothetical protein